MLEMLQIHTDIRQGSDEWHQLRLGKITGSLFSKLLGTNDAKEKYLYDRASEIVTGCRSDSDISKIVHIQRGHGFESEARSLYVIKTFTLVSEVGLIQLGDDVACSPDGLVDEDGLIEIKVPDSNNYFRHMLEISSKGSNAIPYVHYIQMQFHMYVCGRQWCDYVLYNPQHVVNNKELFIHRVQRAEEIQTSIGNVLDECVIKIKKYVELYYTIPTNT